MSSTMVPYLMFDGSAREAMEFYRKVLGGELILQPYGEQFPETPAEQKDKILHAQLKSDDITIMASDSDPNHSQEVIVGNNVSLSIIGTDIEKLTQYFEQLAEGGKIEMPLEKQFWGDVFGALVDKFGVNWMVNISKE